MRPIHFPQVNIVWAEQQPQYLPLPAYSDGTNNVTRWQLTWWERIKLLCTGRLWLQQMHFNEALQPQRLSLETPFVKGVPVEVNPPMHYDMVDGGSLNAMQQRVGTWSKKNFGDQISKVTGFPLGSLAPLLGMVEEIGELIHAVLKRHQGIRGYDNDEKYRAAVQDAMGDIFIYGFDFATREGFVVEPVLQQTVAKVTKRDWVAHAERADAVADAGA